jgi:hypothetical protein
MWQDIKAVYPDIQTRESLDPLTVIPAAEQDISLENVVTTLTGKNQTVSEPASKRRRRMERLISLISEGKSILRRECGVSLPLARKSYNGNKPPGRNYDEEDSSSECECSGNESETAQRALHKFLTTRGSSCMSSPSSTPARPSKQNVSVKEAVVDAFDNSLGSLDINSPHLLDAHRQRKTNAASDACRDLDGTSGKACLESTARANSTPDRPLKKRRTKE